MRVVIDGNEFTREDMDSWKKKRVKNVSHNLGLNIQMQDDVDIVCAQLTKLKIGMSYDEIVSKIKFKLALGKAGMKIAAFVSGKKRRASITTIYAEGITVQKLSKLIDALMLENTEEHRRANLAACPDHYVLLPHGETLEVIETAGGSPVPTQFFITFDDETGLQEPRNPSYPYQSTGIAKLKDGTIIGGVRHQFRNTQTGIEARTLVEFPGICPNKIINEHKKHLAVEWSSWINWAIEHQE